MTLNMIATDVSMEKIFEYYNEITRTNVIKLLLRCKKMYEARIEVKKILTLIFRKEILLKWFLTFKDSLPVDIPEPEAQKIYDLMRLTERLMGIINQFRTEHKIFKGQFLFRGSDYMEICQLHFDDVSQFISAHAIEEFGMRNPVRDATAGINDGNLHKHVSEEMQGDEEEAHAIAMEVVEPGKQKERQDERAKEVTVEEESKPIGKVEIGEDHQQPKTNLAKESDLQVSNQAEGATKEVQQIVSPRTVEEEPLQDGSQNEKQDDRDHHEE